MEPEYEVIDSHIQIVMVRGAVEPRACVWVCMRVYVSGVTDTRGMEIVFFV